MRSGQQGSAPAPAPAEPLDPAGVSVGPGESRRARTPRNLRAMIQVCFAGVTGWTAPPIVAAIDQAGDLALSAGVSRSAAGKSVAAVLNSTSEARIYATVAEAIRSSTVDVLVDYTSASAVKANVWAAVEAGVHAVVGSSGMTSDDYDELDRLARDRGVGVVAAGNFSIMAAVLQTAASMAAQQLDHWEILDYADAGKPDVPSGTSRELAETLAHVRRPEPALDVSDLQGPLEARGAEIAGTRIHSMRLPSFVVTTEIVFGGAGERLVMRHDPGQSPDPYVAGTLLAIRRVAEIPGVRRGLGPLLFGERRDEPQR